MSELYIGLMSGTSLDGVDGVLVDFSGPQLHVRGHVSAPLPVELKAELLSLNTSSAHELHRAALAANALVRVYSQVVETLLNNAHIRASAVLAIGAHGQTVRHQPGLHDETGYTIQLNQPALLAELCGVDVVADFRSRDVAAGGQGAPLVPPFHAELFAQPGRHVAVLNLGGISNLTLLPSTPSEPLRGFDCGPANALMDAWCQAHTGAPFDDAGRWAASGQVHASLLARMQSEPFFHQPPPKSTGRDLFHLAWLDQHLTGLDAIPAQDVQATLAELTAWSCAQALNELWKHCDQLIVCGGGALNLHEMARLQALLPGSEVLSSAARGLPPLQVEATAFAWLARQAILRKPSSVPSVTGAKGARILGAIYPA